MTKTGCQYCSKCGRWRREPCDCGCSLLPWPTGVTGPTVAGSAPGVNGPDGPPAQPPQKVLDLTKPIQTRGGMAVRLLCTDSRATTGPLAVLRTTRDGKEELCSYRRDGFRYTATESLEDLVNVRTEVVRWRVRLHDHRTPMYYLSSAAALSAHSFSPEILYSNVVAIERVYMFEDELP